MGDCGVGVGDSSMDVLSVYITPSNTRILVQLRGAQSGGTQGHHRVSVNALRPPRFSSVDVSLPPRSVLSSFANVVSNKALLSSVPNLIPTVVVGANHSEGIDANRYLGMYVRTHTPNTPPQTTYTHGKQTRGTVN